MVVIIKLLNISVMFLILGGFLFLIFSSWKSMHMLKSILDTLKQMRNKS